MVAHEKNSSTDKQGKEKDFQQINKEIKKTLYSGVSQSRPHYRKELFFFHMGIAFIKNWAWS